MKNTFEASPKSMSPTKRSSTMLNFNQDFKSDFRNKPKSSINVFSSDLRPISINLKDNNTLTQIKEEVEMISSRPKSRKSKSPSRKLVKKKSVLDEIIENRHNTRLSHSNSDQSLETKLLQAEQRE